MRLGNREELKRPHSYYLVEARLSKQFISNSKMHGSGSELWGNLPQGGPAIPTFRRFRIFLEGPWYETEVHGMGRAVILGQR